MGCIELDRKFPEGYILTLSDGQKSSYSRHKSQIKAFPTHFTFPTSDFSDAFRVFLFPFLFRGFVFSFRFDLHGARFPCRLWHIQRFVGVLSNFSLHAHHRRSCLCGNVWLIAVTLFGIEYW